MKSFFLGVALSFVLAAAAFAAELEQGPSALQRWPHVRLEVRGIGPVAILRRKLLDEFDGQWRRQEHALFENAGRLYPYPLEIVAVLDERRCTGAFVCAAGYTKQEHAQLCLVGSQTRIIEVLLPHECNHLLLHWRFHGKSLPICLREGVAMLFEPEKIDDAWGHARTLARRRERPTLSILELFEVEVEPEPYSVQSFSVYSSSYWQMMYLKKQGGCRGVGLFLEKGMAQGNWQETLLKIEKTDDLSLVQRRMDDFFGASGSD